MADPPVELGPFVDVLDDVNPCTGLTHPVTIETTFIQHTHDDMIVIAGESTLTTSSGFSGQGRTSFVGNSQVARAQFLDMLTNEEGDRIQSRGVLVFDFSTETVRVDSLELVCVGS